MPTIPVQMDSNAPSVSNTSLNFIYWMGTDRY